MTGQVMKKKEINSIQYFRPSSGSSSDVRRRRFAEWLPWKLFQDQMNPDKANHGWFIGRYARECLHILPNLPTSIKWPFHQTSVLEWHQVFNKIIKHLFFFVSNDIVRNRWTNR
jgi:hypothetical protein